MNTYMKLYTTVKERVVRTVRDFTTDLKDARTRRLVRAYVGPGVIFSKENATNWAPSIEVANLLRKYEYACSGMVGASIHVFREGTQGRVASITGCTVETQDSELAELLASEGIKVTEPRPPVTFKNWTG